MITKFQNWSYGLFGGMIGGGASAVTAWLGMSAAQAAGVDVPTLNWKAMGVIAVTGIVTHAMAYLAKSPLPPLDDNDTGNPS